MSFELGEAFVKVSADTAEAEKSASGLGGKLMKGIGVGVAATAALSAALGKAGFSIASTGDELDKTSKRIGVTTDFLQDMSHWADQNGLSSESLERAVGRLNQRIGDGSAEGNKYVEALNGMGVATQDSTGAARDAEAVMRDTVGALAEVESETERAALATEVFGTKTARDLMPAIMDGSLTLEEATAAMDGYGRMTEDQVAKSVEFTDSWNRITTAGSGFLKQALFPVVEFMTDRLFPAIETGMGVLGDFLGVFQSADGIVGGAKAVFEELFSSLGRGEGLLAGARSMMASVLAWLVDDGIPQIFEFIMASRERLFSAAMVLFPALLDAVVEVLPRLVEFITGTMIPGLLELLVTSVPQLLEAALTLFGTLLDAVVEVLPGLLTSILGMLPEVVGTLLGMIPELLATAVELFMALLDAVMEVLPQLLEVLPGEVLPNLLETVLGMLPELLTTAVELFLALVTAVIEVLPELLDTLLGTVLPEVLSAVLGMLPELLVAAIEVFMALVLGLIEVLPELLGTIIGQVIPDVIVAVLSALPQLLAAAVQVFMALVSGLIEVVPTLIGELLGMIPQMVTAIMGAVPKMLTAGKEVLTGLWDGVKEVWTSVLEWFRGIPEKIRNTIPNPLNVLKGIGGSIMSGLTAGIRSGFDNVKGALGDLTGKLTSWKGPPEKDAVILKGAGHLIMGGLVDGLKEKEGEVRAMLQGLTGMLQGDLGGSLGVSVGAAGSAALAGAGGLSGGGGGGPSVEVHQTFQGYSPDQIQHATQRALRMEVDAWTLSG